MTKIIFATGNRSKLAQMRFVAELFKFPVGIVSGRDLFGDKASYDEIGNTVEEVARHGALAVAARVQSPVIVEDTDFRIDALQGEPGIRAGEFLKKFGRAEILKRMKGIINRKAVINSALCYATPDGMSKIFVKRVEGMVAEEERFGDFPDWAAPTPDNPMGGGYSSIFIPNGLDTTISEMDPKEVIPWSYRERNFMDVIKYILDLDQQKNH